MVISSWIPILVLALLLSRSWIWPGVHPLRGLWMIGFGVWFLLDYAYGHHLVMALLGVWLVVRGALRMAQSAEYY